MNQVFSDVATVRQAVIQYLAVPFGGDELAAEYTLLHLLSTVYARVDARHIGRFLLNITGCPRDAAASAAALPAGSAVGTSSARPLPLESFPAAKQSWCVWRRSPLGGEGGRAWRLLR